MAATHTVMMLRTRFGWRGWPRLAAIALLASTVALASDQVWPYPLSTFQLQGESQGWDLWIRQLQDLREEIWCLDSDDDGTCERLQYSNSNGDGDICHDADDDGRCNYRKELTADGSYSERVDEDGNGIDEYVYLVNTRGAEQQRWTDDRSGTLLREMTSYSLAGEVELLQDYQVSTQLVIRWFDAGQLAEQVWDTDGDGVWDAYCTTADPACHRGVAITPQEASRLMTYLQQRHSYWYQRVNDAVAAQPADPLTMRYLDLQYNRIDIILRYCDSLASGAGPDDYHRSE